MEKQNVFEHIAERTGGDIYIGVVGPVRTGKSTFIKKMMELAVIPHMKNEGDRARAQDELPQSAAGRTIMTTEPKFVPNQAVKINVSEGLDVNVRMVDCVGYTIPGAKGHEDEYGPRMVHTPWYEDPIPFHEAAEIGTRKVIQDHSTIGVMLSTDGTIGEIPRESYVEMEERIVAELQEVGKPFIMVLNSARPYQEDTEQLRKELQLKYDVPVVAMSVESMRETDVMMVLKEALYEFPVLEVNVQLPGWVMVLDNEHWLRTHYESAVSEVVHDIKRIRDVDRVVRQFEEFGHVEEASLAGMDMGAGAASIDLKAADGLYEQVLEEFIGERVTGKDHFLGLIQEYTLAKKEYDQFADALKMVRQTGYGIAAPVLSDMSLDEPEIIRQGARYGVRLKAVAPSIHMIKVDVESEFSPIIGTEKQSEELVHYLMQDFEDDPLSIWSSDIFGRSLSSIVREGIQGKLSVMPENARYKLKETLERVINEGSGGMIAIIL
ncbi:MULTISPECIES: stage IV sporulation protein A [Jeotgalibacillus]|uniref:stage IV sporulation protein A n=1 Tax=Jeotgalibacillus TaxID=157226 RepID=UPI00106D9864|nr:MULTISPECIES: stage IV sporulation protein A [Jeotgalibacillus]TFE00417.1 stage IV sporulation protein A [Jeotgalibacillus sp. R-1-5s-1]